MKTKLVILLVAIALLSCDKDEAIQQAIQEPAVQLDPVNLSWQTPHPEGTFVSSNEPMYYDKYVYFVNVPNKSLIQYDTANGSRVELLKGRINCFGRWSVCQSGKYGFIRYVDNSVHVVDLENLTESEIFNESGLVLKNIYAVDNTIHFAYYDGINIHAMQINPNTLSVSYGMSYLPNTSLNVTSTYTALYEPAVVTLNGVKHYLYKLMNRTSSEAQTEYILYNTQTKFRVWIKSFDESGNAPHSDRPAVVDGQYAYFVGYEKVYKIDLNTGNTVWSITPNPGTNSGLTSFVKIVDGKLICKFTDNHMYGINLGDGSITWTNSNCGQYNGQNEMVIDEDKLLYVTTEFGTIEIIDVQTGQHILKETPPIVNPNGFSLVMNKFIYTPKSRKIYSHDYFSVSCIQLGPL